MVVFTCNHCGESLQKPRVEKHYSFTCRVKKFLTCVDCLKDFRGNEYDTHTKCITEEERYSGKDFVQKIKKGEVKQESWMEMIKSIIIHEGNLSPHCKNLLNTISNYNNVPRKKVKFINFIKSSTGGRANVEDIEEIWNIIEKSKSQIVSVKENNEKANGMNTEDIMDENNLSKCTGETKRTEKHENTNNQIKEMPVKNKKKTQTNGSDDLIDTENKSNKHITENNTESIVNEIVYKKEKKISGSQSAHDDNGSHKKKNKFTNNSGNGINEASLKNKKCVIEDALINMDELPSKIKKKTPQSNCTDIEDNINGIKKKSKKRAVEDGSNSANSLEKIVCKKEKNSINNNEIIHDDNKCVTENINPMDDVYEVPSKKKKKSLTPKPSEVLENVDNGCDKIGKKYRTNNSDIVPSIKKKLSTTRLNVTEDALNGSNTKNKCSSDKKFDVAITDTNDITKDILSFSFSEHLTEILTAKEVISKDKLFKKVSKRYLKCTGKPICQEKLEKKINRKLLKFHNVIIEDNYLKILKQ